ncbi:MAG: hypothetical protein ACOCXX_04605, partial [Planctomycetota bacterium]
MAIWLAVPAGASAAGLFVVLLWRSVKALPQADRSRVRMLGGAAVRVLMVSVPAVALARVGLVPALVYVVSFTVARVMLVRVLAVRATG